MLFSTSKVMHIGKLQKHYPLLYEEVTEEKDLGVLISNDLKDSEQCQFACTCRFVVYDHACTHRITLCY